MDLPETPDELFCLAVYRASHAINRAYSPHLRRLGLTYPQYICLQFLWQRDQRTVGDLAQGLGMETNTLTPLLKRMEAQGLVVRRRSDADARQVLITLTDAGQDLSQHAPEITRCMVEATGLSPDALAQLVQTLDDLSGALAAP